MNEMATRPWYHRAGWMTLLSLLAAPVGLFLVWTRSRTRVWLRLVASLGLLVAGGLQAHYYLGLQVELAGSAMTPIFSFYDRDAHFARLERQRAAQASAEPAAVAATDPVVEIATAAELEPAPVPREPAAAAIDGAAADDAQPQAAPAPVAGLASGWTTFRGRDLDGVYHGRPIADSWPATGLEELWRQPVGEGYSSFAVLEGAFFTIEQRRDEEVLARYDLRSGREEWTVAWPARFSEALGGDGPRSTPAVDRERVYALGATGELVAVERGSGKVSWRRNILEDAGSENIIWGMAGSPLRVDDLLVVHPGGRGSSVVALRAATGEVAWRALDDRAAYSSPMVATLAGRRQLLLLTGERLVGLEIASGAELWSFPWTTMNDISVAQPLVVSDRRVFVSSGYGVGAALVEITAVGDQLEAREAWKNLEMKNKMSSSVIYQGMIYGLDEGILACIDAETGQRRWKGGRYGHGQLLLAGHRLIVLTERGDLVAVEATPEGHREVASASVLRGKTWNNPAIEDGVLLVRNAREMAAFRVALGAG